VRGGVRIQDEFTSLPNATQRWRKRHRATYNKWARRWHKKATDRAEDSYIRQLIKMHGHGYIKDIPQDLIDLWRLQLIAKRKLREAENGTRS
jgi:hypothetical protein